MKNIGSMKIVIALVIAATMLVIGSALGSSQSGASADADELRDALRRGGLREAARLKGHYVGEYNPHWDFGQFDVEALTKNSVAVVLGVPSKKTASRLNKSGRVILTDYEVTVSEVFKGPLAAGNPVTVSLPGGRVEFEDGTSAELRARDFEHVRAETSYVFFLSESGDAPGAYVLSGGPQ